jgi:surface protein
MSIRSVSATPTTSNSGLGPRSFGTSAVTGTGPWVRNPQWLTLPTVSAAEQKVVGLYRIDENSNFLAFRCLGNYTVDWGDGTTENFSSNTSAYHEYDYTNAAFDGTLTDDGYKQTIVTITPQAGQNLTSFSSAIKHNQSGLVSGYSTGLLDLIISLPNGTSLTLGISANVVVERYCERVTILSYAGTSWNNLFAEKTSLQSVNISGANNITSLQSMFSNCYSLKSVPLFNTANVTNMSSMFTGCIALETVPLFNTAKVTTMSSMFSGCLALQTLPAFNAGAAITASSGYTSMFGTSSFNALRSLSKIEATGFKFTFSIANCKLSSAKLNELYTNLATVTGQTITVTGNYGVAGDDPTIATAKGWTVTG